MGLGQSKPIPVSPLKSSTATSAKSTGSESETISGVGVSREGSGEASSIAFSYTHVKAPNASSYAPQSALAGNPGGWTMVSKAPNGRGDEPFDPEVENEIELDIEGGVKEYSIGRNRRIQEGKEAIKYDVEDIVNGEGY